MTGSVVRQNEFVGPVNHGIEPWECINSMADAPAEERRLLYVTVSRTSDGVLLIATDSPDDIGVPSPSIIELVEELDNSATGLAGQSGAPPAVSGVGTTANEANAGKPDVVGAEDAAWVDKGLPWVFSVESLLAELRAAVVGDAETETQCR